MADGGSWFKLWCSALDDEALDNLPVEDFGRWAKLGAYIKCHGESGSIVLRPPSRTLCAMLQLPTFEAVVGCLLMLPNVTVSGETIVTVSFRNWHKYQGDLSTSRVQRFRARETVQKRREENRGDQKKEPPPTPPKRGEAPDGFETFWNTYPSSRRRGRQEALQAWRKLRLTPTQVEQVMASLASWKRSDDWLKDDGKYIPWPQKFLNRGRWQETVEDRPTFRAERV